MQNLIASLRIFISGAWLSYIGLFTWTGPRNYTASKILAPLTYMLFFVYLGISTGSNSADFYIIGNALQMAAINGVFGMTMVIGLERNNGTLLYLVGSPANRLMIFLGRAFFNILDGYLTILICLLWGLILGLDLSAANLAGLALTILIVTVSTCGLGLLLGSMSLVMLNVMFLNNTIFFLLFIFSGANVPLDRMPVWMQWISAALPLTRGIQAARLLVNGAALSQVLALLLGELAIGTIYAIIGFVVFRWFEFHARRRGFLEAF